MWKVTEHKSPKNQQEVRVKTLIKEMAAYSYASYAEEFKNHFEVLVNDLPKTNNYAPELMFKITQRNLKSIELWKLKVNGDFDYKMFTLDYQEI
jgi:hypothetical protein